MKIITIREAKINLSTLIREACEGKEIVIARAEKPVVRLVPIADVKGRRQPGALRGKLRVGLEFFEPLADEK
jgi:prevent-host-death family protein